MAILETINGFLWSIFANTAYDMLKGIFKSKDSPSFKALVTAINKATDKFYKQYGLEFGSPENSFLAKDKNWNSLIYTLFLSSDDFDPSQIDPEGFDGSKRATIEAITFFVEELQREILLDYELNKLVAQKQHYKDTDNILDKLKGQDTSLSKIATSTDNIKTDLKDTSLAQAEGFNRLSSKSDNIVELINRRFDAFTVAGKPDDDKLNNIISTTIDRFRDFINKNQPKVALSLLSNLKERHWRELTDHARFRVLTNIAAAKLKMGFEAESAKELLDAECYAPGDVKALCNSALAYIILGQHENAMQKAREAVTSYPENPDTHAILITAASKDPLLTDPLLLIPEIYHETPEVAFQLSEFYRGRGNIAAAKMWIKKAYIFKPDSLDIQERYAISLLNDIFEDSTVTFGRQITVDQLAALETARDLLNNLWEQFKHCEVPERFVPCAINLGNIERLLGNGKRAEQIIVEAINLNPNDVSLKRHAVFFFMGNEKVADACAMLAELPDQAIEGKLLMEAEALWMFNKYPEALIKVEAFLSSEPNPETKEHIIAQTLRVYILRETKGKDAALKESIRLVTEYPEVIDYLVLVSHALNDNGLQEEALEWAEKAKTQIENLPIYINRALVADMYFQLGLYNDAAEFYDKMVFSDQNTRDLRRLLICLMETDRRRDALERISNLSEDVRTLPFYSKICAELYNRAGDLKSSRKYLETYLKVAPADLRARLSWVGLLERMGHKDVVLTFLDHLPNFPDAKPEDYVHLSQTLARYGKADESLVLAYETLRRFRCVPIAHLGFFGLIIGELKDIPLIERVKKEQRVELDTAFVVEMASGEKKTFIIESSLDSTLIDNEISAANPIALRAIGLKCGEELVVLETPFKKEVGRISEIKHKYLYALHNSMANYEYLFPSDNRLFSVPIVIKPEGDADFTPFFDVITQRYEEIVRIENIYQTQPLPISMISKHLGVNPIDGWFGLCRSVRTKVAYCQGNQEERNEAFKLLLTTKTGFILDPVTLFSLFSLDVLDEINIFTRIKIGITQSTLDLIGHLIESRRHMSPHGSIAKEGEHFCLTEFSEDDITTSIVPFEKLLAWCKENTVIIPAVGKKVITGTERDILSSLDTAFIDTLLAAEGSGKLLLSDDLYFRHYSKYLFGVEAVWSQPLLHMILASRILTYPKYIKTIITLFNINYSFVYITSNDLIFCSKTKDGPGKDNFEYLLSNLNGPNVDYISIILLSANYLSELWSGGLTSYNKEMLTYKILNVIIKHPARKVEHTIHILYLIFSKLALLDGLLAPHAFIAFKEVLRKWCQGHFLPVQILLQPDETEVS